MIDEIRLVESSVWYTEQSEKEDVYCEGWNDCNRDWMERIETVPKLGEWIPCSERLPEEGQTVLIQYVDRHDDKEITIAVGWMGYGGLCSWDDRVTCVDDCVAWIPLPEPYVEGVKE